ncbi:MAG: signal peptidase I [Kiritimatiellae bacterium]|nr:signal peptidase I [Kiritimatiellia bacterium]
MLDFLNFLKARKALKVIVKTARTLMVSKLDLFNNEELTYLKGQLDRAEMAYKSNTIGLEDLKRATVELEDCVNRLDPPKSFPAFRENYYLVVVCIAVVMAFRAYFFQPFKIPTGSMQPTLYGIHTVAKSYDQAGLMDIQPFRFFKWLVTGTTFNVIRAKKSGTVSIIGNANSKKPGYTPIFVAGIPHYVPNEVVEINQERRLPSIKSTGIMSGDQIKEGDVLWSGKIISGDFVFVNRWRWNFFHPKRGEVMVFSTNGIKPVQQGIFFIKRMMGLPLETLQIAAPNLLVNGEPVTEPLRVGQISRQEKFAPWAPNYAGFNPGGKSYPYMSGTLPSPQSKVTLGADQYYAIGDNSFGSEDSRHWGPVPERNLIGNASVVYWPFTSPRLGLVH